MDVGNRALSTAHMKHVVMKVFHIDDGMFTNNSTECWDVRSTTHVHRLKGNHHNSLVTFTNT